MMPPFRLGMLGMWHVHSEGLVRQICAHPQEFQLVAGWDPDPALRTARSDAWRSVTPELQVVPQPEDVLGFPLDGVVVEGRVYENLALARQAMLAGFPVLLEKPAGDNLPEFRRLVHLAQQKRLHLQMLYLFRYLPTVREMLRIGRSGELGDLYTFRARMPKELSTYERFVDELLPYRGGIFFEMAGHVIDLMIALLGPPREIRSLLTHCHRAGPRSFVDHGAAIFATSRGIGSIEVPAMEVAPEARRIEIFGTRGGCVIPHLGSGHLANRPVQPVEVFRVEEGVWRRTELPNEALQIHDLREFAAVVRGEKEPDFTLDHDLMVQTALLEACQMA